MPLKPQQQSLTIDEQIENLKNLNLTIQDENFARLFLNDVSYFRFIKAYSLGLKPKNGNYYNGVSFEHIVELYRFNANLRQELLPHIERVEINLRARIANYFSVKYGTLGYKDSSNFTNSFYHQQFINNISQEINRNKRSPFIKNYQNNYQNADIPFYALVEIISFGTLSKFYKNLLNDDKKHISKSYGVSYKYFESWIESIAYVRNLCAHYGRLYNAILTKKPILYKQFNEAGIRNDRLFGILCCLKELVPDDHHWDKFVNNIEKSFSKYPHADKFKMGFPINWIQILK
ncbi:MAG: Abi family protein [Streptococcaceae bacterium]|jgi:abortive infection bacteriophage resistance protein|nr:Abi family protein [Streptococcaceae bacterium]